VTRLLLVGGGHAHVHVLAARQLRCANGDSIPFGYASIDCGPAAHPLATDDAAGQALPVRPIEGLIAAWPGLLQRVRQSSASSGRQ